MGWEALNSPLEYQKAQQALDDTTDAQMILKCFSTPAGKKVLEILEDRFYHADPIPRGCWEGQTMQNLTFENIGRRAVVKWLRDQIRRAQNDGK